MKQSLALFAILIVAGLAAPGRAVTGYVQVRMSLGRVVALPAALRISSDWSRMTLETARSTLHGSGYSHQRHNGRDYIALWFSDAPGLREGVKLLLYGEWASRAHFNGTLYADDRVNGGELAVRGRFRFPERISSAAWTSLYNYSYPPTSFFRGTPVYRGFAPSGDVENPCPLGPCWTDAGVSRHLEYYSGGIQNPGRPSQPARFMSGVPYSMTREGQLEAQRVGIERMRMLEPYLRPYYPLWGFFWAWW